MIRESLSSTSLMIIKMLSTLLFKTEVNWNGDKSLDQVKFIVFLHHTSLYEPLFVSALPNSFIWKLGRKMVIPGASKTLNRPLVGKLFKLISPYMVSISRKRDHTWDHFLKSIKDDSIVIFFPEGRMKRANGLDADGNVMSIKKGIIDLLPHFHHGHIAIVHSGGLHHVQTPGQLFPNLFQTIKLRIDVLSLEEYKNEIVNKYQQSLEESLLLDLQHRLDHNCPK